MFLFPMYVQGNHPNYNREETVELHLTSTFTLGVWGGGKTHLFSPIQRAPTLMSILRGFLDCPALQEVKDVLPAIFPRLLSHAKEVSLKKKKLTSVVSILSLSA